MSYRSKQPIAPSRHRSSSAVRTSSAGTSYSNRPRSMGYYSGASTAPFSTSQYSSASSNSNYPYSSSYQSPYFQNGYRNGSTYASLSIPASKVNAYTSSSSSNNPYSVGSTARTSRRDLHSRNGSYRDRSVSRSRSTLPSNGSMGSRSLSLTSLNSDTGYISGSDRSSRSRISSTVDIRNENGEIDYKKLYEQQLVENDRLKDKLKKSEEELKETKQTLEKINVVTSKNSLSELEKRERRAMERKLSEMEEELKQLQKLKAENERLKADNRSLTRVINKLTNSPKK